MTRWITLLTRPDCRLSEHAKAVLDRIGRDVPFEVEEIPLDSERGRALSAWVLFAPGILLDGKPFGFGRLPERPLRDALQAARPQPAGPPPAGHGPAPQTVDGPPRRYRTHSPGGTAR